MNRLFIRFSRRFMRKTYRAALARVADEHGLTVEELERWLNR